MTSHKSTATKVVVVDGSNIATEGRSTPSLAQLNEAVMAFTEEFPDAAVTVVVDATFGHRIDKKEQAAFDEAVAHNELVAPPAGAIGRGDAFVLSIANKVGARVLSNDSFQEFHGVYPWLFEEGRLIGGKPVPYVGWVFVERLPVKGPVSRKATRAARGTAAAGTGGRSSRRASKEASLPMPVPTAPPPGGRRAEKAAAVTAEVAAVATVAAVAAVAAEVGAPAAAGGATNPPRASSASGSQVNDLLPFLDFVEHHPVGSSVNGVVESYSSHGAYIALGDVRGYVPLRLMGDPPPRSAREVMKISDAVTLVVTSFAPARRSIDLAVPKAAPITDLVATPVLDELAEAVVEHAAPTRRGGRKKAAATAPAESVAEPAREPAPEPVAAQAVPARKPRARKEVATVATEVDVEPAAGPRPVVAKKPAARKTTKKAAAVAGVAVPEPAPEPVEPAMTATPATPATTPATKRRASKRAATTPAADESTPELVEPAATPDGPSRPPRKRAAKLAAPPPPAGDGDSDAPTAPAAKPARRRRAPAAEVVS